MKVDYLDPVCGMRVQSGDISAVHDGTLQVFCSTSCRDTFLADPIPFLASQSDGTEQGSKEVRRD